MMNIRASFPRAIALALALAVSGCAAGLSGTLGTLGTLSSIAELLRTPRQAEEAPQQVELTAEVRQVDTRRQLIQVETADGRAGGVTYDLATLVVHEQQPYPLSSLQPGDLVTLLLERAAHNNLYASRVSVVRLAQEERAPADTLAAVPVPAPPAGADTASAREAAPEPAPAAAPQAVPALRQLEGAVGEIDPERGRFHLHPRQQDTVTVSLPFNAPAAMVERFHELSRGDTVRVEIHPLGGDRGELRRFLERAGREPSP